MKVNVLGTEYEIIESSKSEYPKLEDLNGYCELHSKKIIIDDLVEKSADRLACENLDIFKKKVIRHELLHAFLYESGIFISDVTPINEEELVEWIAVQFPKMLNVFKSISVDTDDLATRSGMNNANKGD